MSGEKVEVMDGGNLSSKLNFVNENVLVHNI